MENKWLASFPGRFTPRKETRNSLHRRLSWFQRRYGCSGEEENILLLPVVVRTGLHRLNSCR